MNLKNGTTLYLEYWDFETDNNRFDNQKKSLSLLTYRSSSIKSGLILFQADSGIKFPNNLYSSRITYQVLGGTYDTKSDATLVLYGLL